MRVDLVNDLMKDLVTDLVTDIDWDGEPGDDAPPPPARGAPRRRLYALRGMPCPLCRRRGHPECALAWTGVSLACPGGHGWSNADALRDDLLAELRGPGYSDVGGEGSD